MIFSEELQACKEAGLLKRKPIQLFQFKYYIQQTPLQLSEQELDDVKNAVIHPPDGAYEARLIASKILIKVRIYF
jgi:hypothetical protein